MPLELVTPRNIVRTRPSGSRQYRLAAPGSPIQADRAGPESSGRIALAVVETIPGQMLLRVPPGRQRPVCRSNAAKPWCKASITPPRARGTTVPTIWPSSNTRSVPSAGLKTCSRPGSMSTQYSRCCAGVPDRTFAKRGLGVQD